MLFYVQALALSALRRAYSMRGITPALTSSLLHIHPTTIRASLIKSLSTFGRHRECLEVGASMLALPPDPAVLAYVLMFSSVQWADAEKIALVEVVGEVNRVLFFLLRCFVTDRRLFSAPLRRWPPFIPRPNISLSWHTFSGCRSTTLAC